MATALVTGVAGFIGSTLAEALLERGDHVRGVDTFATGRRSNLEALQDDAAFEFREADIRDADAMADAVAGVDHVYHQAAIASVPRSVEDPVPTTDVNCTGTATVLDAARRAGVDTAVVASSTAVYGAGEQLPKVESMPIAPTSPYALSKYYTEELALEFGEFYDMDTVALRYFNVFGPRQDPEGQYAAVIPTFISRMLDGDRPVIHGDGGQTRDFVHVDDVVRANLLAADGDVSGEAINVGTGRQISITDLVDTLNDVLDADIQPVHDDPRPGDIRHSYADISKARELLDYEPQVGFEAGLERTVEYYR